MAKDNLPRFYLVMTEAEREIIRQEAERRGMLEEESNILREGLRLYFDKYGTKLPSGVFENRKRGNRLPKENHPLSLKLGVA